MKGTQKWVWGFWGVNMPGIILWARALYEHLRGFKCFCISWKRLEVEETCCYSKQVVIVGEKHIFEHKQQNVEIAFRNSLLTHFQPLLRFYTP